jgi:hypothetical protein
LLKRIFEIQKITYSKGGKEHPNTMKITEANWIGHMLRRNCVLKRVIEGKIKAKIEVKGRRGRRRKELLDCLKEKKILELERRSTRSPSVGNSLWESLWKSGLRLTTRW